MERLLIIGHLPEAGFADGHALPHDCKIIALFAAIAERLEELGVPHAAIDPYVDDLRWEPIHAEIERALQKRSASTSPRRDLVWRDDWSHPVAMEVRVDVFWARVARRIVEIEQPIILLVQEPCEAHSSRHALRAIASACDLLGQPYERWELARA